MIHTPVDGVTLTDDFNTTVLYPDPGGKRWVIDGYIDGDLVFHTTVPATSLAQAAFAILGAELER